MQFVKTIFRAWFYFRNGWSLYLAFIMAGINTLTITYYLAIEKYPLLLGIFPTFASYVVLMVLIAVPILTAIGYLHYKKSGAFKGEIDIYMETDPYQRRTVLNTEMLMPMILQMSLLLAKISKNEKITDDESTKLSKLQSDLSEYINLKFDKRYLGILDTDLEKLKASEKKLK
jgi:hypothetical protein|tara:strand:+ start:199 stop:717 length:519 start_codon:yes stop_codon:yes gene_type:complete